MLRSALLTVCQVGRCLFRGVSGSFITAGVEKCLFPFDSVDY